MGPRTTVVLMATAVLGAGVWLLFLVLPGRSHAPSVSTADVKSELGADRNDLAELRRELEQLRRQQQAVLGRGVGLGAMARRGSDDPEAEGDVQSRAATAAVEDQKRARAMLLTWEQRLLHEPRDQKWTNWVQQQVDALKTSPALAGSTIQATCSASLCRLQLRHQHTQSRDRFFHENAANPLFAGEVYLEHHGGTKDEPPTTLVFLSRPGAALPSEPL